MDKISLNIFKRILNDKDLNSKIYVLKEIDLEKQKKKFIYQNFVENKIPFLD